MTLLWQLFSISAVSCASARARNVNKHRGRVKFFAILFLCVTDDNTSDYPVSEEVRNSIPCQLSVPYGEREGEKFDVFGADDLPPSKSDERRIFYTQELFLWFSSLSYTFCRFSSLCLYSWRVLAAFGSYHFSLLCQAIASSRECDGDCWIWSDSKRYIW